jgi:hypothetical protein
MRLATWAIVVLTISTASGASAQTPSKSPSAKEIEALNISAYTELLRSDIRTQKIAIIGTMMEFNGDEDKKFWPIYRDYDAEMKTLGDQRVALIAEYAKNYATLTDGLAETLAKKALDLEEKRQGAKAKCYDRLKGAISPMKALRFLQIEQQLQLLIDLQISASLPIVMK